MGILFIDEDNSFRIVARMFRSQWSEDLSIILLEDTFWHLQVGCLDRDHVFGLICVLLISFGWLPTELSSVFCSGSDLFIQFVLHDQLQWRLDLIGCMFQIRLWLSRRKDAFESGYRQFLQDLARPVLDSIGPDSLFTEQLGELLLIFTVNLHASQGEVVNDVSVMASLQQLVSEHVYPLLCFVGWQCRGLES